MRTIHDLKDLAMIYGDFEWDRTPIKVWCPGEQRHMELTFTGSVRPDDSQPGELNFNAHYVDKLGDNCVFAAFNKVMDKIIDSRFDMSIDWEKVFLENLIELRKK